MKDIEKLAQEYKAAGSIIARGFWETLEKQAGAEKLLNAVWGGLKGAGRGLTAGVKEVKNAKGLLNIPEYIGMGLRQGAGTTAGKIAMTPGMSKLVGGAAIAVPTVGAGVAAKKVFGNDKDKK
jgi:hypothetical protein